MQNDLENAFAALSDDAGRARLAPAAAVRKRADRQTLTRSLSGVAAAVVLVTGVLVGSRIVLTDNVLPPSPPLQSSAPTAAPPSVSPSRPSSTPSSPPPSVEQPDGSGTSTSGAPTIPKTIPDRAFLHSSDVNGGKPYQLARDALIPLTLCGPSAFDSEKQRGVRAGIHVFYEDGRKDYTPLFTVDELITVYRGDGAEKLLDESRAEMKNCSDGGDDAITYHPAESLGLGDESFLVRGSTPARGDDGELSPGGGTQDRYVVRIRVEDTVVELLVSGYESQTVKRAQVQAVASKAVQRLKDWRN